MDRITPSINPVNPVNPVLYESSFSMVPDINTIEFIKAIDLSLLPLRSLRLNFKCCSIRFVDNNVNHATKHVAVNLRCAPRS